MADLPQNVEVNIKGAAKVETPIQMGFTSLSQSIENLDMSIERLINLISPVLGPNLDAVSNPVLSDISNDSELAIMLQHAAVRIRDITESVQAVSNRVEL